MIKLAKASPLRGPKPLSREPESDEVLEEPVLRQTRSVIVYDSESTHGATHGVPERLIDAAGWLTNLLASVPKRYRSSAKIEINGEGGYEDMPYASVRISYRRRETWAEARERATLRRPVFYRSFAEMMRA